MICLAHVGVSGAYVSARFGVSGVSSLPSYVVINAAYTGSSTITVTNGLGAAVTPNVVNNVNRYYYSSGGQWASYRYSQGTTGTSGNSVDMSGWKFACGSSSSSLQATVPGSFTIAAGATAFVICLPTTAVAYQTTTAVTTNVFSPTPTPTSNPTVTAGSPTMSPNIPTATPTPKPTMIPTTRYGLYNTPDHPINPPYQLEYLYYFLSPPFPSTHTPFTHLLLSQIPFQLASARYQNTYRFTNTGSNGFPYGRGRSAHVRAHLLHSQVNDHDLLFSGCPSNQSPSLTPRSHSPHPSPNLT